MSNTHYKHNSNSNSSSNHWTVQIYIFEYYDTSSAPIETGRVAMAQGWRRHIAECNGSHTDTNKIYTNNRAFSTHSPTALCTVHSFWAIFSIYIASWVVLMLLLLLLLLSSLLLMFSWKNLLIVFALVPGICMCVICIGYRASVLRLQKPF